MKKLLDVGCGPGTIGNVGLYETLKKHYTIYGIDFLKSNIRSIKERFPQGKFSQAEATSLPFDNNYFDIILARHIFEHVEDPEKVLAEIKRVLKPRALITIAVPHEILEHLLIKILPANIERDRHHQRIFTEKDLLYLLKKQEFTVISSKQEKWPWFVISILLALLSRFTDMVTLQEQSGVFQVNKKNYLKVRKLYSTYLIIYKVLMSLNRLPFNLIIPFEIEIIARNKKR